MMWRVRILANERAGLFRREQFVRMLGPGVHWTWGQVVRVDMGRQSLPIDFGPAYTKDAVPVGVEMNVAYRVADPEQALRQVTFPWFHLWTDAQAAVVRSVSTFLLEELAPQHNRLELDVQDRLDLEASTYGVRTEDVRILRVRYPRAIRKRMKRNEVPGLV